MLTSAGYVTAPSSEAAAMLSAAFELSQNTPAAGTLRLGMFGLTMDTEFESDHDHDVSMTVRMSSDTGDTIRVEGIWIADTGALYVRQPDEHPGERLLSADWQQIEPGDAGEGLLALLCDGSPLTALADGRQPSSSGYDCGAPNSGLAADFENLIAAAEIVGPAVIDGRDTTLVRFEAAVPDTPDSNSSTLGSGQIGIIPMQA